MQAPSMNTTAKASGHSLEAPLRACSTSGCRVSKYVEMTRRKCAQFVSEPYIMSKPLLVNGKTSVFQVGGQRAKLGDIPSLPTATGSGNNTGQPIYRIKPGTHAHVINYVFIDEDSETMEKVRSEDPETMRKLFESQCESATAKLQKLMSKRINIATTEAPTTTSSLAVATTLAVNRGKKKT